MADTLPNVTLTGGVWKDLYDATGIAVGTKLSIQNLGGATIRLAVKATSPLVTDGYNELSVSNDSLTNTAGDSGAWAFSPVVDSIINVTEA